MTSTETPSQPVTSLQYFLVQGVFLIVLIGVVLPVGLVAMFLAFRQAPVRVAVEHGELFLAGGNAVFMGSVAVVAARQETGLNAVIAALVAIALLVIPCYAAWAYLAVLSLLKESYSEHVVVVSSAVTVAVCLVTALTMIRVSYSPTT